MSLSALDYKKQANEYYSKQEWSSAIDAYSEGIKQIQTMSDKTVPLYLLYLNRSAAYIQEKNFYSGYRDVKESLKLKSNGNFKGFYRAGICAYHLGFIDKSKEFLTKATEDHQENLLDYLDLKLLLEKKVNSMKRWRKPNMSAKKCVDKLEEIIQQGLMKIEIPSLLYQIRYLLRASFENQTDQKLMDMSTDDLGLRLHELALDFNSKMHVEQLIKRDPLFEDMILYEMPDVGLLRLNVYKQRQRDCNLEEKASADRTAYEFSFFINNILASLAANSTDENISLRALKQIHHFMTNDLYRKCLGEALSDSINNYIYYRSKDSILLNKLVFNGGIEIFFYDYLESSCQTAALNMINNITVDQWKKQSKLTIEFVLKQISRKIQDEDTDLIDTRKSSIFEIEMKKIFGLHLCDRHDKQNFYLIINVLMKILLAFGKQPFLERSSIDPLFLFIHQNWLEKVSSEQYRTNIPRLIQSCSEILTQWIKLDSNERKFYSKQMKKSDCDD